MKLDMNLIDFLKPEHDRTSCSDERNINFQGKNGVSRCGRCALIEVLDGFSGQEFQNIEAVNNLLNDLHGNEENHDQIGILLEV